MVPFYFPSPLTRCQPGKWRCQPAQDSSRVEASYVAIPQRFGFLFAPISLTTTLEDLPSSGHCNLRWPRTSYLCDRFGCKGNLNAFEQIRTCSSVRTDLSRCVCWENWGARIGAPFGAARDANLHNLPQLQKVYHSVSKVRTFGAFKVHVYSGLLVVLVPSSASFAKHVVWIRAA